MGKATSEVGVAVDNLPEGTPYAAEIRAILSRAYAQALEDEAYWAEMGKPYLRTFLGTTPLGIAILELAYKVNEGAK